MAAEPTPLRAVPSSAAQRAPIEVVANQGDVASVLRWTLGIPALLIGVVVVLYGLGAMWKWGQIREAGLVPTDVLPLVPRDQLLTLGVELLLLAVLALPVPLALAWLLHIALPRRGRPWGVPLGLARVVAAQERLRRDLAELGGAPQEARFDRREIFDRARESGDAAGDERTAGRGARGGEGGDEGSARGARGDEGDEGSARRGARDGDDDYGYGRRVRRLKTRGAKVGVTLAHRVWVFRAGLVVALVIGFVVSTPARLAVALFGFWVIRRAGVHTMRVTAVVFAAVLLAVLAEQFTAPEPLPDGAVRTTRGILIKGPLVAATPEAWYVVVADRRVKSIPAVNIAKSSVHSPRGHGTGLLGARPANLLR